MSLNALLSCNNFPNTDDFRRLIVPYLQGDALMATRLASKPWSRVADAFIDDGVESGEMMVHDRRDFSYDEARARQERHKLVTRVIFLLILRRSEIVPATGPSISSLLISPRALRDSVTWPSMAALV
ncbi:hypothetical protein TL16_g11103 [Triparma laevis f. inornata]|uniref:Uncharacterized protein n=2 Tax=Triparma laevis TaxID=1534972 RepID=A0A9W6ZBA6_9STRA|nr:hypothetical protein TrLO_g9945 [Triparma laevis f. longispina]GMH88256.1 hypothetical protein TL16_g11103 [Triparma laevis f. inornata]